MIPFTFGNMIIPYFTGYTKAGLLLLIPIIIIEATLLKILLKKKWYESFKFCTIANIISTLAGAILIIAEGFAYILLPIIFFLLFPGACILSIWIENKIYRKYWKDIPKRKLLTAVIIVNIITYVPLLILANDMHKKNRRRRYKKIYRISCSSNLKQIGLSLKQYAMDYNDFFPNEGFEQLYRNDYLTDYTVYLCPSNNTPIRTTKNNPTLTTETVDYIYRKGLKDSDDSETPLAWDKPENHENYGNVLFIDGHVEGFKGADWMEQAGIKKQGK